MHETYITLLNLQQIICQFILVLYLSNVSHVRMVFDRDEE